MIFLSLSTSLLRPEYVDHRTFPSLLLSSLSQVNLVVPGPEQPLVDGVEMYFRKGASQSVFQTFASLSPIILQSEYRFSDQVCSLPEWKDPNRFQNILWRGTPSPRQSSASFNRRKSTKRSIMSRLVVIWSCLKLMVSQPAREY